MKDWRSLRVTAGSSGDLLLLQQEDGAFGQEDGDEVVTFQPLMVSARGVASIRGPGGTRRWAKGLLLTGMGLGAAGCFACWLGPHRWWAYPRANLQEAVQLARGGAWGQSQDFCGRHEPDVEFHTRFSLHWIGNISNAEMCCAECDGVPECSAWTYGKMRGIEELSDHCFLKMLGPGEEPQRMTRPGVISGLLKHRLQKHGIVAALLETDQWERGTPQASESDARPGSTCPGRVEVEGHGRLQIVAAAWRMPGEQAAGVRLEMQDSAIKPSLSSRAYMAANCSNGAYKNTDYVALRLLGRTFRYSIDLSGAGCGCNAQLHLAPLRSNKNASDCGDFHCDASASCGVSCAEIAVQDANQYAWATTMNARGDTAGISVGYGGGESTIGRRNWDSSRYGPGAECIDTTWPFTVSISFPVDGAGELDGVHVTLTQDGHDCDLSASVGMYSFESRDGLAELSRVLENGLTPVISYWSSRSLMWLDGIGADGAGPCVKDSPEACPASVRFFDFSVSEGVVKPKVRGYTKGTPVDSAIEAIHGFVQGEAKKKLQDELEMVLRLKDATSDANEDCGGNCGLGGSGAPVVAGAAAGGAGASYIEAAGHHLEWEVLVNKVHVRRVASYSSELLGDKMKGEVLIGKRLGDWIKLRDEDGYVAMWKGGTDFLKERVVTYEKIISGSCQSAGLFPIEDLVTCKVAGFALGYFATKVSLYEGQEERPEGCYLFEGQLWLSTGGHFHGRGASGGRLPICSTRPYPTTTATTITTTTTLTSTTTSTTWGTPSLFCFLVMMRNTYEYALVKEQIRQGAGIWSTCDEHAAFSQDAPFSLGKTPNGHDVTALWFEKAHVGTSEDGTAGNALLFVHVFKAIKKDGRYRKLDWTIKADPDAVVLPQRIRTHLAKAPERNSYLVNCNKMNYQPPFPMIFGAFEAYSKHSLEIFLERNGMDRCLSSLPWKKYGEDKFMGNCMRLLGSHEFDDFTILADNRCLGANCQDGVAAAYHDFKSIISWFDCWGQATV